MLSPRLYSIFTHKCPRCLHGEMYPDPNPYHLKNTSVMNHHCDQCDLPFMPEPGYYYGAMYVSYAFTVAISVAVGVAYYVLFGEFEALTYLIALTVVLAGLSPWTFRTSRAIWINFFVKFNKELYAEAEAHQKAVKS